MKQTGDGLSATMIMTEMDIRLRYRPPRPHPSASRRLSSLMPGELSISFWTDLPRSRMTGMRGPTPKQLRSLSAVGVNCPLS